MIRVKVQPLVSSTIDWAEDDEGGLPSIVGLQAKFRTSGTATPAEDLPPGPATEESLPVVDSVDKRNESVPREESDGFTQARAGRVRGRGGRGDRGVFRGGFRGNGDFRGERGFRVRGSFRGTDRGLFLLFSLFFI
jgi:hypothetical protein